EDEEEEEEEGGLEKWARIMGMGDSEEDDKDNDYTGIIDLDDLEEVERDLDGARSRVSKREEGAGKMKKPDGQRHTAKEGANTDPSPSPSPKPNPNAAGDGKERVGRRGKKSSKIKPADEVGDKGEG
ncbi:unnamed protein product, partial [Discosporangium mesarthrocarpum]